MAEASGRPKRLEGKVAMVAGAGCRGEGIGIGRAISILLTRKGARVGLLDRNPEWAAVTRRMIGDEGGEATVIETDVTGERSCQAAVDTVVGKWRGLDTLVNVVGTVGPPGPRTTSTWRDGMGSRAPDQRHVHDADRAGTYCLDDRRPRFPAGNINSAPRPGLAGGTAK